MKRRNLNRPSTMGFISHKNAGMDIDEVFLIKDGLNQDEKSFKSSLQQELSK